MSDFSALSNAHPSFIENLYQQYLQNPASVDSSWQLFFNGFDYAAQNIDPNGQAAAAAVGSGSAQTLDADKLQKELSVLKLIDGYRHRGHLLSDTNPLRRRRDRQPHLEDIKEFGLTEMDFDQDFAAANVFGLPEVKTLRQVIAFLKQCYCGHIGFEYSHIEKHEHRLWLRERIEHRTLNPDFGLSQEKKQRILEKLNGAVGMEEFLAKKFSTTKRFGLEGGESTIPALDAIINKGVENGVQEVVIGMAHRGRLNVLSNIIGKTYKELFNEFEGGLISDQIYGSGDVKYHMGYSAQGKTVTGKDVYLKLLPNPSHLEAVDAVMLGFARAKADILYGSEYDKILPIMIHGDASVAGQGIVYEVLQMSKLEGYKTGGTIHFVINNQVGFTTDFDDARSSNYCTSVANTIQAPTFHVNGDDPEAVVFACELAVAYRQEFNVDVFVDMVCYRKNGHNESDNPEVTQPQLYKLIKNHKNPRKLYLDVLDQRDHIDRTLGQAMAERFDALLQDILMEVKQKALPYKKQEPEESWQKLVAYPDASHFEQSPETGVDAQTLELVLQHLRKMPEGATLATPLKRMFDKAYPEFFEKGVLDWSLGELLAYGTVLAEGRNIRFSGEDVKRGTFSHRNVVLFDTEKVSVADKPLEYNRLDGISEKQGKLRIYNSLLSEYAVLGFEYGYGLTTPDDLVIWEAQFGDFGNGAQIMIDQFIAAGESKWNRQNGLVMLLPHGYEGQGPEHSSARLERFLQLCAENNMTVANVTTPANLFHLLRRQLVRPFRKPLVLMTPKSLLRHPLVVSELKDFAVGTRFHEVLDDATAEVKAVKRVLFCTGKVYYDLLAKKQAENRKDIAIVRVEQLYPFPETQVKAVLAKYKKATAYWVQEESKNMGAWMHIATFHSELGLRYNGRPASASPATGLLKTHNKEQAHLVDDAFDA